MAAESRHIPPFVVDATERFGATTADDKRLSPESQLLLNRGILYPEATREWLDRGLLTASEPTRNRRPHERVLSIERALDQTDNPPSRRAIVVWSIDREALAAHEMPAGDVVDRLAASWLYAARELIEPLGIIGTSAWCTSCGSGCIDHRGTPRRIRRLCDRCGVRRHKGEFRICAARDCISYFWTTRSNHLFCDEACEKAERRGAKRQRFLSAAFSGPDRP